MKRPFLSKKIIPAVGFNNEILTDAAGCAAAQHSEPMLIMNCIENICTILWLGLLLSSERNWHLTSLNFFQKYVLKKETRGENGMLKIGDFVYGKGKKTNVNVLKLKTTMPLTKKKFISICTTFYD